MFRNQLQSLGVLLALVPFGVLAAQDAPAPDAHAGHEHAPAGQEAPAPAVQVDNAAVQVQPSMGQQGFGTAIEDIDLYRMERPRYVRRLADRVPLDLGPIDLEADVIMTVDGTPITRNDFRRRAAMYLGINFIEDELTRLVTEMQVDRLVAAGADRAALEVTEQQIDERLDMLIEFSAMQARGQAQAAGGEEAAKAAEKQAREDFLRSIETSIGMEKYRKTLRAEAAFERAFLPMPTTPQDYEVWDMEKGPIPEDDPKPDWIPQITWDALSSNEAGRNLRYFVKKAGKDGSEIPGFFRSQITSAIRHGVVDLMGKKFFFDEQLPDSAFMRLGDHEISTEHVWNMVKDELCDADVEIILREMLTLYGVRKTLSDAGAWMDTATTEAGFADLRRGFEGTLFPLESIILLRGYPSVDRYREHWRYKESYNRWRKKLLTEEELEAHYRTSGRLFFERGSVGIDLAFAGIDHGKPFEQARFDEAVAKLQQAYADSPVDDQDLHDWSAVRAVYPPSPTRQSLQDPSPEADRHFQRNPLRMRITESELSIFLLGYSMADDMVYNGRPGEVFGPFPQSCRRHAWGAELNAGAWMARVADFTRSRPLPPMQGVERDQALEDFLDLNYWYWSQECLESVLPKVVVTRPS